MRDCFTLKEDCKCDTKNKIGRKWDNYDGIGSLVDVDISDAPLLTLARKSSEVLTYVHLVKEEDDSSSPIDNVGGSSDISDEEDNWDCFDEDSDEEAEFEG